MRGAARRAERGAEGAQIAHAGRGGFENREAAQQRLRAGLLRRDVEQRARQRDRVGIADVRLVVVVGLRLVGYLRRGGCVGHVDVGVRRFVHGARCSLDWAAAASGVTADDRAVRDSGSRRMRRRGLRAQAGDRLHDVSPFLLSRG